jgi:hypothetical protein
MPRMIDLIRASAVPANLMQAAARGSLAVPAQEMIEILVHLARHNSLFGQQARMTMARWEESSARAAASDPKTSAEVLDYLVAPENLRLVLLPVLLENPAVTEESLAQLARSGSRQVAEVLFKSARVTESQGLLTALQSNPNLPGMQRVALGEKLTPPKAASPSPGSNSLPSSVPATGSVDATTCAPTPEAEGAELEPEVELAIQAYVKEHAEEISAEADKPFQPLGGAVVLEMETAEPPAAPPPLVNAPAGGQAAGDPPKQAASVKKVHVRDEEDRGSALQKISKLDVKGRIQLAMKGTKEERSILVRDGTKLVALAVLDSPKITDGEVEKFAAQKNVLEALLRAIPLKRRFAKNYIVVRNLVANPRTPIDLSLGLMKHILVNDLRNLAGNKEVSDTVRKLAMKMFKQKTDLTRNR